jgi:HSP20 family molecular chaperone IbpA
MEINYGPFRRIVLLPVSVRTKEAKARYTNGFLEVKLPFSDEMSAELMVITID